MDLQRRNLRATASRARPWSRVGRAITGGWLMSALLLGTVPLGAQTTGTEAEPVDTEEKDRVQPFEDRVVVTAARSEQDLETLSASVSILDAEALANTPAASVDEALRYASGFSLFRRSSSLVAQPTTQGVSLRGIGPSGVSRTVVLLDGEQLNDPFGGWIYWSRVPLASLDRVEIVRGGGSDAWGSAALGGVIQLFSRRSDRMRSDALVEVGERSQYQVDLSHEAPPERRLGFRVHGNAYGTGGYRQRLPGQSGAIDIPADSEHWQFNGRLEGIVSPSTTWSLRGEIFDEERSNGTPLTDNSTELDVVSAALVTRFGSAAGLDLSVRSQTQDFAARFSAQADDRASETPALDQFLVEADTLALAIVGDAALGSNALSYGVDARRTEGFTNERFFFSGSDFLRQRRAGGEEQIVGLFLQDRIALGERVQLQLGARWDRWETRDGLRFEFDRASGNVRLDDAYADRSESQVSPRLGLVFAATDALRLRASAYRAFRAPTINELYRPFRVGNDITAANPALAPEELEGVEAGVTWTDGPWTLDVTAFRTRLDDPVANVTLASGPGFIPPCGFTPGGGTCRQRQNLGRTSVDGAEFELQHRFGRGRLELAYQFADSTFDAAANVPALVGNRVPQVPRHSASIRTDLTLAKRWSGEVGVRYAGDQFEDDRNERELDAFTLVGLGLRWRVTDSWTTFLRVDNATDEDVEVGLTADGILTVGAPRTVRVGLRWDWSL